MSLKSFRQHEKRTLALTSLLLFTLFTFSACSDLPNENTSLIADTDQKCQVDPEMAGQWWVHALNLQTAWLYATGKGVTIASCDSGFRPYESDLFPNLLLNQARDTSDKDKPYIIIDGLYNNFGTANAAIMVGARDGNGTNGIAFDAKLIPIQAFNYDSNLDDGSRKAGVEKCVRYANFTNADIIVLQLDSYYCSAECTVGVRTAVKEAIKNNKIVVTSAGNYSSELKKELEDDTGSIIVGALRKDGKAANFSNYGDRVTIAAFGEKIRTLVGPNGRMENYGNTNAAASQVAATVALMLEIDPDLTQKQVIDILLKTRDLNTANAKVGGQLDTGAAVKFLIEANP